MLSWLQKKRTPQRPPLTGLHLWHQPQWTSRTYENLTREGYMKNVILYRAINMIAHNMASVPWTLYKNGHQIPSSPLARLIEEPNFKQSRAAFMESLTAYILLSGNAYVECVGEGEFEELYLLRPDRVTIQPGPYGAPKAYEYRVGSEVRVIPADPVDGSSRILHIKTFHPLNDWYGLSPMEAAASAVDQHNAVGGHNLSLLQNGGRLSGALLLKGEGGLSMEERESLKMQLQDSYQGPDHAGRLLVLEGDMEWKEMGLSPKDLDFLEGKHISAREISQAYGVPPMLLGIPGDSTFSNYKEARFHLWEDTILPLLNMVISEFNRWMTGRYGESVTFTYDVDSISALALRREPIWERLKNADFLTVNEKRQALGYPPLPEKD